MSFAYAMVRQGGRWAVALALAIAALGAFAAESKNLAPGFDTLPTGAKVVLMPPDVELYELGAGGFHEPKADWTEAAQKHLRAALESIESGWNIEGSELPESDTEAFGEVSALHAAVAQSIETHHFGPRFNALPNKAGKLDWSFGDAVAPLRDKTQADYALFIWIRDGYNSSGRIAASFALALIGMQYRHMATQAGYASLVDLRTGQVMWFNRLQRQHGDLRTPVAARDSLKALLQNFPFPR